MMNPKMCMNVYLFKIHYSQAKRKRRLKTYMAPATETAALSLIAFFLSPGHFAGPSCKYGMILILGASLSHHRLPHEQ